MDSGNKEQEGWFINRIGNEEGLQNHQNALMAKRPLQAPSPSAMLAAFAIERSGLYLLPPQRTIKAEISLGKVKALS
ncbi:hypothetical protein M569_12440 [Genlisea aurea]|uniref:Uncharacterized protein n=1 Tax=Genlisea aurea TaxID=192259 RepID=S8C6J0_9LAMI|nr:hypothetical protein M569_12440 [Genlisea aurea]